MSELKTLKDLEYDCNDRSVVNYHELKAEAIKDYKEAKNYRVKSYIKWKFNLTDEDLK